MENGCFRDETLFEEGKHMSTGGTIAAWTFAKQGQRVAVIERKYVGGSCPNIACLPSKNIIHSAKVASYLRRSEEFGIAKRDFTERPITFPYPVRKLAARPF